MVTQTDPCLPLHERTEFGRPNASIWAGMWIPVKSGRSVFLALLVAWIGVYRALVMVNLAFHW
jgi:hypothetical protein